MSYRGSDMVAAAEAHYQTAAALLTSNENKPTEVRAWVAQRASAEAAAGLLAMKLADYAFAPMADDR